MNRIVVCLDCPHYQKGGYCIKTRKDVGALTPACDKAPKEKTDDDIIDTTEIIENAPQTTKKCERCGENLPLSMYEWINTKDGRKLRRICSNCYHEAMRRGQNKHKPTPPKGKKTCSSCGKTLPLSDPKKTISKPKTMTEPKTTSPTPAPVLNESIATMKTTTANPFSTFKDHELADELRARGYEVTATRTVTITL